MDFWRSGQARTYRDPRGPRKSMSVWQRISGFHFPAWVPVVGVMIAVFGILGVLFVARSAVGAPRIGEHWHAALAIFVNEEQLPRIAEALTAQGIHTHGDGMIHIHPHNQAGEGNGARIANFFGDQGGRLTNSEMRLPGRPDTTYRNGDDIDGDGRPEELRILRADSGIHPLGGDFNRAVVACNGKAESEFERVNIRYVPKDGDCIRIVFAPPEVVPVVEQDRTIIADDQADREIEIGVTGTGAETAFTPASINVEAGETVRIKLTNQTPAEACSGAGGCFHGLRFSGADRVYGNSDDYVLPNVDPGVSDTVVIRYDAAGEFEFRDEQSIEGVTPVTGKVIVGEPTATPPPNATATPVPADLSLDISVSDTAFEPAALSVEAGKTFSVKVTNTGAFVHKLRIAGADGEFETEDDIVGGLVDPGGSGELSGKIDAAGSYPFRDDFRPTQIQGTLTVQ
jgi:plastocyanin